MKAQLMLAAGLTAAAFFTGCETIPPGAERGPDGTMAYEVIIESSEPGVRIQANGQDAGTTPLTLKIYGDPDGTFHDFGSYEYVIQAFPVRTNQFVQSRVFQTGRMLTPQDRIPRQIYFDMNQPPTVYVPQPYPYYYPPPPYYHHYGPPMFYGPRVIIVPRHRHHRR
jgi:hypothetical protein